ncbi:hypothetical protein [Ferrimonas sp.]|uniref:hypothetical protein n=1 Tax=Ferrimonas sp. TaxID=2080861 RepID=UPI003A9040BD
MKTWTAIVAAFTSIFFSSFCWSLDAPPPLEEGEGYVFVVIHTPWKSIKSVSLHSVDFFGDSEVIEDLEYGENIRLIKLKEGKYSYSKIKLDNRYYIKFDESDFTVDVSAGSINYGGHFFIYSPSYTRFRFQYVNRISAVLDELESCCEDLLEQYDLRYRGRYPDPFMEFYESERNKVEMR